MIDAWRRSRQFRRKVQAAGKRIAGRDWVPIQTIQIPQPNQDHSTDRFAILWPTIYDTPHYNLLTCQRQCELTATDYWAWQVSLRGIDHPRPDYWIFAMTLRLRTLHDSIHRDGYRLQCVADRIAIMPSRITPNSVLWDGAHRLACLAAERWVLVPVVVIRRD